MRRDADPREGKTRLSARIDHISRAPFRSDAQEWHPEVICELVRQVGIEESGGASGGVDTLPPGAPHQHVDTLTTLTDAGVVHTGVPLIAAAGRGPELSNQVPAETEEGQRSFLRKLSGRQHRPNALAVLLVLEYVSPPRAVRIAP